MKRKDNQPMVHNIADINEQHELPLMNLKSSKRMVKSLEYELIAHLVMQQFQTNGIIEFERLLSIPMQERIPGFVAEYGAKRMHKLLVMVIREFSMAIPLPKSKKLNDTRVSVCACDIMLSAYEDQLSLEDIILFFERAKAGKYKPIKKMLTHQLIREMFDMYRQERHLAYTTIKDNQDAALKAMGPTEHTSPEPTAIKNLFPDAGVQYKPLKKIS